MNILVIGGYGSFGKLLSENLLQHSNHDLIIAGRSLEQAKGFQQTVKSEYGRSIVVVQLDITSHDFLERLGQLTPDIVVNASGPYQYQAKNKSNYSVARACVEVGCHYIDLADDRLFVTQFENELDALAKRKGCILVGGASTVPGLTSAVVDNYANNFTALKSIYFGISPGNQFSKGKATVGSILTYTGRPYPILINSQKQFVYGWQGCQRYDFGKPLGKRWMANCQIPDLDLLPQRYPELESVNFQAGLELRFMHFSMWLLSAWVRLKLLHQIERFAGFLSYASSWFDNWGSDKGGMFVRLSGLDKDKNRQTIDWQLIAENGVGPNTPVIAAELVISKISQGKIRSGAMPCMGLFSLKEFFELASRWGIYARARWS